MTFNINYLSRVSTSANATVKVWMYNGSATGSNEAVAAIAASGYFNNAMTNLTLGLGILSVNDVIYIMGNNAAAMYTFTAVTTAVTVSVFAAAGTVGTANITDLSVTTGKLAADAVTSAKMSPDMLKYAAVAVTAAEFNGMYAAPKVLVAAGGADTLLVLDRILLAMTYGAAAFAAGGVAHVQYAATANGAGIIASTTLAAASFQDTASTVYSFNAGVVEYPFATVANQGLYLSNITGAFTTGDSDFVAHIWYKEISLV